MNPGGDNPARRALRAIARDAGRSRLGDRMPEEEGGGVTVSIGLAPKEDPNAEIYEHVGDDAPTFPGHMRAGGSDPDAEIYGSAGDDEPELPGSTSIGRKRRNR